MHRDASRLQFGYRGRAQHPSKKPRSGSRPRKYKDTFTPSRDSMPSEPTAMKPALTMAGGGSWSGRAGRRWSRRTPARNAVGGGLEPASSTWRRPAWSLPRYRSAFHHHRPARPARGVALEQALTPHCLEQAAIDAPSRPVLAACGPAYLEGGRRATTRSHARRRRRRRNWRRTSAEVWVRSRSSTGATDGDPSTMAFTRHRGAAARRDAATLPLPAPITTRSSRSSSCARHPLARRRPAAGRQCRTRRKTADAVSWKTFASRRARAHQGDGTPMAHRSGARSRPSGGPRAGQSGPFVQSGFRVALRGPFCGRRHTFGRRRDVAVPDLFLR